MTTNDEHVSDLMLDRLCADEYDASERTRLEQHLAACQGCEQRFESILHAREAFLARQPTWSGMVAARRPARVLSSPRVWGAALLAAAGVLLVVMVPPRQSEGARAKGAASLGVFIKRGEQVVRADSGDEVRAGDLIRLTYTNTRSSHLGVLRRDSEGVTIDYPLPRQSQLVAAGRDVALNFSLALDAAPGHEELYALFCDAPSDLEHWRAVLQQTGQLTDVPHCQLDHVVLNKQSER